MAEHFGAAGTDIDEEKYGGLYSAIRQIAQSDEGAAAAIAAAEAMSPATEKVDAAQLAIRFFSQMGANAAQPGSTALSAAASALPSAANYLAEVNKRNRELERARGPLAIQLATAMKPKTSTAPVKVMVDGKAVYMSAAEAIKRGLPVYEKDTNTNKAPKAYSVTEENLALLNKKLGLNLTRDTLGNVLLTPSQFTLGQNFVGSEVKDDTDSSQPAISKLYDALENAKEGSDKYQSILNEIKALERKALFDKDRFSAEKDLRTEWQKLKKPFDEVELNFKKLKTALTDESGAGDMSSVFIFMKMLDPGSVVRESEFKAAQQTAGLIEQIVTKKEQYKEGDILSSKQRKDFLKLATDFYNATRSYIGENRLDLGVQVDSYDLTPKNIFGYEAAPSWFYLNPDVFKSANKGNTTIDAMWLNMTEEERKAYYPSIGEK